MLKSFQLIFITLIATFIMSCNNHTQQTIKTESESKPNIIYILADDLGYGDVSFNGQSKFTTPNIDKMATNGMVFTNHYSGSTVCAPSRSALLTGQHTGHTPVRGNFEIQPEGQWPMPDSCFTLAEMLKKAGYVTGAFGKWGLGYPGSEGDPNYQGFDEFYGFNCQRLGHHYYPYYLWHNQEKVILEKNANGENITYAPDVVHKQALKFIEANKDTTFFMYYPSIIPHAELSAPEEYMQKFRGKFNPEFVFKGTDKGDPKFRKGSYGSQAESHAAFAAMITLLDDQVGEIFQKLYDLGIADNTLVIFTSDNGPHQEGGADPNYFNSNGGFKGFKRDLYEGGIHVPMIALWPEKIVAGSSSDHISAFWDMMPTFAELSGIEPPKNIDGISMLPSLLNNKEQQKHDYLYWEFHEKGGRIALRKDNWKAVRYNVLKDPNSKIELYDLSIDPSESNNVADEHPDLVKELTNTLENARTNSSVFTFSSDTYLKSK
jgi:arylsulfatase A-like enzyme